MKLKASGRKVIARRHPWVFSGAIEKIPDDIENGSPVYLIDGDNIVASGLFSQKSMIAVRIMAFDKVTIDREFMKDRISAAAEARKRIGFEENADTTGYRLVYGESDGLPGLVVDRYGNTLVLQISTAGTDKLRETIVEILTELYNPTAIYEKSDLPSRLEEGLKPQSGQLYGADIETIEFRENGRTCLADIVTGQKTGFYLDQRDLRQEIYHLAKDKKTADLFSYTGAAGIAALVGGASSVDFVDSSAPALALCRRHAEINGFNYESFETIEADIFQWLGTQNNPKYDLVLLDPPALIKSQKHIDAGVKAYHFLNRAAIRIINDFGILVTSSCSSFMTEEMLLEILHKASNQAGVSLNILKVVHQSPDHPVPVTFPEAAYLKSFICQVRRK